MLKSFAKVQFKSQDNLLAACNYVKNCILNDESLPVNVEACIALQELLSEDSEIDVNPAGYLKNFNIEKFFLFFYSKTFILQFLVKENFGVHIRQLMLKMLNLIRDTENDDVSNVIQKLIYVYEDELSTFAVEIMQHLVSLSLKKIFIALDLIRLI